MQRIIFLTAAIFLISEVWAQNETVADNELEKSTQRPLDRRPSFWTKTIHHLKTSTPLRRQFNKAMLRRRVAEGRKADTVPDSPSSQIKHLLKEFMNETATLFAEGEARGRSYAVEEQPNQVWEDKDQAYHASNFPTADYEVGPYHHHYMPPNPVPVYYQPQKKDDTLFTKFALLALLKLILAKLKAIGLLKFFLFLFLKIPLVFFKFLIILKGFKLLKLVSIPFLIASFIIPFLPLIPLLAPLLLLPLLFLPLLIPLLLPLLLFLPIVPVTTPPTAQGRRKRDTLEVPTTINNQTWSVLDEQWKAQSGEGKNSDSKARYFRTRSRPASMAQASSRQDWRYVEQYNEEDSQNLLELTQRVVHSGHCMERVACELANSSDSKIYQKAVVWILGKILSYAPDGVKRNIEKYSHAYTSGAQRRSIDYCSERFHCQRPRILLIQGKTAYNVF